MTIGDALVDVVLDEVPQRRPSRIHRVVEWLVEISKPPVGVRLVSDDGGTFSGFVVVEDNRPLLMLAVRTGGTPRHIDLQGLDRHMPSINDELWPRHDRFK